MGLPGFGLLHGGWYVLGPCRVGRSLGRDGGKEVEWEEVLCLGGIVLGSCIAKLRVQSLGCSSAKGHARSPLLAIVLGSAHVEDGNLVSYWDKRTYQ
jgi:hypothetical protein